MLCYVNQYAGRSAVLCYAYATYVILCAITLNDPFTSIKAAASARSGKPRVFIRNVSAQKCAEYAGIHSLAKCDAFLKRSIEHRINFV